MKTKTRTAHVEVTDPKTGTTWLITLAADGSLAVRIKRARKGVTITSGELIRKAQQLSNGSLML